MRIGSINSNLHLTSSLDRTTSAIARSLQRLSTGRRINSPADDAAGFSLDQKLESQVRGLSQGISNISEAQALVAEASAGVQSQLDLVRRMREIALTASNVSLDAEERKNLKTELQSLVDQFRRVTTTTQYNGQNLLDGSFTSRKILYGDNPNSSFDLNIASTLDSSIFTKNINSGAFTTGKKAVNIGTYAANYMQMGDLNNDGKDDIVIAPTSGTSYTAFLVNGNGSTTSTGPTSAITDDVARFKLYDVNHDNNLDIVGLDAFGVGHYWLGNGDGTFQASVTVDTGGFIANRLEVGDLDGDGDADLVLADTFAIATITSSGGGILNDAIEVAGSPTSVNLFTDLHLADLNGDDRPELLVTDGSGVNGHLLVMLNSGSGGFSAPVTYSTAGSSMAIKTADFNRDGKTDIAVMNYSSANMTILLGDGAGGVTSRSTVSANGGGLYGFDLADGNGDGVLDIYVRGFNTSSNGYFLGNANGTFNSFQTTNWTGSAGNEIFMRDFDGDGILDALMPSGTGSQTVLYAKGKGSTVSSGSDLNIDTSESAQRLVTVLDSALTALQSRAGDMTALHSRLDEASAHRMLLKDVLEDAKQNNLSADLAAETAEAVRLQILQEAQVAVRAQSTISMSIVLKLLEPLG